MAAVLSADAQLGRLIDKGMINEALDHANIALNRMLTEDEMRRLAKAYTGAKNLSPVRLVDVAANEVSQAFARELQSILFPK